MLNLADLKLGKSIYVFVKFLEFPKNTNSNKRLRAFQRVVVVGSAY